MPHKMCLFMLDCDLFRIKPGSGVMMFYSSGIVATQCSTCVMHGTIEPAFLITPGMI